MNAHTQFLKYLGLTWEQPKNTITKKIPFIPTEQEIDDLIAGNPQTIAAFLQIPKETAMRSGEAIRLRWADIDLERRVITCNDPEKNINTRQFNDLSGKLLNMLSQLPQNDTYVFAGRTLNSIKAVFARCRAKQAFKLGNVRLKEIHLHTFRHWKATQLYYETKDPYYVKDFLGHRELRNTEIYINIERTIFQSGTDGFTVKVTDKVEDVKSLLEVGFEYVCQKDNLIFLRKRK